VGSGHTTVGDYLNANSTFYWHSGTMKCLTFNTVLIYIQHTHRPIGNYLLASYMGDITLDVLPTDPKILCTALS